MELADLAKKLASEGELHLRVKVVPRSSRNEVAGFLSDGTLKIRIQAPPEKGKANAELCSFLAKALKVSSRNVAIVSGGASPLKRIKVLL